MIREVETLSILGSKLVSNANLHEAQNAFEKAYKISANLDDTTHQACSFNLGAVYIALGNTNNGLDLLKRAKELNVDNKSPDTGADLEYNLGLAYNQLNDHKTALFHFSSSYEQYITLGNTNLQADSLCKIAGVLFKLSRYRESCAALDTAAQLFRVTRNVSKLVSTLSVKAAHLYLTNDIDETLRTCVECVTVCDKAHGTQPAYALAYNDVGLVYTQCKRYAKAAQCFEKALPICQLCGDIKQTAVVLQNLGGIYNFIRHYKEAVPYHEAAATQYAQLKNRSLQGHCFSNLAYAYSQLGDYESAGETLLHALLAATDSGDKNAQWQVLEGLGAISFNRANVGRAIDYFKKALSALAAYGGSTVSQERIVGKLTSALQYQVMAYHGGEVRESLSQPHQKVFSSQMLSHSPQHGQLLTSSQYQIHTDVSDVPTDISSYGRRGMRPGSTKFKTVPRGLVHDRLDTVDHDSIISKDSSFTSVSARTSNDSREGSFSLTDSTTVTSDSSRGFIQTNSDGSVLSSSKSDTSARRNSSDSDESNLFEKFKSRILQKKRSHSSKRGQRKPRESDRILQNVDLSPDNNVFVDDVQQDVGIKGRESTEIDAGVVSDNYATLEITPTATDQTSPRLYSRRTTPQSKQDSLTKPFLRRFSSTPDENVENSGEEREERERVLEEMRRIQDETRIKGDDDLENLYDVKIKSNLTDTSNGLADTTNGLADTTDNIAPVGTLSSMDDGSIPPTLPLSGPPTSIPGTYLTPQCNNERDSNDDLDHTYAIINTLDSGETRESATDGDVLSPGVTSSLMEGSGTYESIRTITSDKHDDKTQPVSTTSTSFHAVNIPFQRHMLPEGSSRRNSVAPPLLYQTDTEFNHMTRAEKERHMYEVQMKKFERDRELEPQKGRSRMCVVM